MLTAIIILALLSLLVATEGEPVATPAESATDKPVRPSAQRGSSKEPAKPSRVAA